MPLSQTEFDAILQEAKIVDGDLSWSEDEDHSPSVEFRTTLATAAGFPIFLKGSLNRLAGTMSLAIVHKGVGRIYGLDLGKDHRNPTGELVGEKHKHRWDERYRDKGAYAPQDITADASAPLVVWQQFCAEANIVHRGTMHEPPPAAEDLFP